MGRAARLSCCSGTKRVYDFLDTFSEVLFMSLLRIVFVVLCVREIQIECHGELQRNRFSNFLKRFLGFFAIFFLRILTFLLRVVFNLSLFVLRVNKIQVKFRFY